MLRTTFVALLVATYPLAAQAPHITPQGDPSVASDTIYRLAVDSAQHPDESFVYLLDDGVVRWEADGRTATTYRQVIQILREDAVRGEQEHAFSYSPSHQKLTINWIRVVKPDGEIVSAKPTHVQESDVPAAMADPVYTDRKVLRASLSGVAVGTIVDWSYTVDEFKPYRPGDLFDGWRVTNGMTTRRSRLILDVPANLHVKIVEHNLDFKRRETRTHGRVVYTWATQNVPRVRGEPYAADSNGVIMDLAVVGPGSWGDVAAWYAGLAKDRYDLDDSTRAKVHQLVAAATTRTDTIRAIHRWVAQDIRYVAIALGLGGYQPRPPSRVVATGLGDCKDKATLFVAALRDLGITAYPVLLSAEGGVQRDLPTIQQFDHAIAAVPKAGGGYTFTDLTAGDVPYGELPASEQGQFALVVHPDGSADTTTMPADSVGANETDTNISGTISLDGTFDGWYEVRGTGTDEGDLRSAFWTPLDSTERANFRRAIAQKLFDGADADSMVAFTGKDLSADAVVRVRIVHGQAASASGDTQILTDPLGSMQGFASAASRLAAYPPRRFPIDASKVVGPSVAVSDFRVTLPDGWHARLPHDVTADSPFGSYHATYEQVGRELHVVRRLRGARGIFPPDRFGDLIAWFRAMGRDNARYIVIDTPHTPSNR